VIRHSELYPRKYALGVLVFFWIDSLSDHSVRSLSIDGFIVQCLLFEHEGAAGVNITVTRFGDDGSEESFENSCVFVTRPVVIAWALWLLAPL